jgi:hypothetical protein
MKVGWMWYDDSDKDLGEKVDQAAQAFHAKFRCWPNACYVNPQALEGDGFIQGKVKIITVPYILPDHFWLGIEKAT